jgi:dTDP-4-amino-4,6-dideoxygalactose transaminase
MIRRASAALKHYTSSLEKRTKIGELYYTAFSAHAFLTIPGDIQLTDALTRFPLLCDTPHHADELFAKLAERHLHPGKWYRPTLFPGPINPATYNYDPEACPVAESLSARILNLPTNISLAQAKEIIDVCNS